MDDLSSDERLVELMDELVDLVDRVDQVDRVDPVDQVDQVGPVDQVDQVDQVDRVGQEWYVPRRCHHQVPDQQARLMELLMHRELVRAQGGGCCSCCRLLQP